MAFIDFIELWPGAMIGAGMLVFWLQALGVSAPYGRYRRCSANSHKILHSGALARVCVRLACCSAALTGLNGSSPPMQRGQALELHSSACRPGWGPTLPTQLAWVVQESPSALIPAFILSIQPASVKLNMSWQARITAAAFITHYVHRAFVYPLSMRPGGRTPMITAVLAYLFCVCNGLLQARAPPPACNARI